MEPKRVLHAEQVEDESLSLESLVREMLGQLGEDITREGLVQTPARVAASLKWLTRGYGMSVEDVIGDALYKEPHDNLVCVRDIEIYSLCEHHMLPFFGRAHVAYLPNGRLVGLSKIPRVIEVFARRLQVQERLTDQVADALMRVLEPQGVPLPEARGGFLAALKRLMEPQAVISTRDES